MSTLDLQGLNDLQSVQTFARSASSLGLMNNQQNLDTFISAAAQNGLLAPGKLDPAAVDGMVGKLQKQGVLPYKLNQPDQVASLLYSARNLGFNGTTSIPEKMAAVMKAAEQLGLNTTDSSNKGESGPPADAGKAITWQKLHFRPYEFKNILSLSITQGINQHARLLISGVLEQQDDGEDYVQQTGENTSVALSYTAENGDIKYLFQGIIIHIRQRTKGEVKILDIEAADHSFQMDKLKQSRSFQRHQEPYSYIFQRINDSVRQYVKNMNGDAVLAWPKEAGTITGKIIVQRQESDWEFFQRLGANFNLGLIPDITFDCPRIYFGPPDSRQGDGSREQGPQLNTTTYQIRRNTGEYAVSTGNYRTNTSQNFTENDFTYIETQSLDLLKLGQGVTFLDRTFYVRAILSKMDGSHLKSTYTLTTHPGLMQDDLYNIKLAGTSLQGMVKEVVKDQVRVHIIEIDQDWDDGGTWFFPYTTVYSSPDGSGLYIMPEVGDNVRIYFPNNKEAESVAVSSINLTPSQRGERTDPDTKIISTVHGKKVILTPGGIQIIANGNLLMTLFDDGGLTVKSDKKILLDATDDIVITSGSKITVNGQQQIVLTQGGGEGGGGNKIDMQGNITMSGSLVKVQPS